MNLLWYLTVAYIVGSAIYEFGGYTALVVAICALVVWLLAVNYPSWVPNRLLYRRR